MSCPCVGSPQLETVQANFCRFGRQDQNVSQRAKVIRSNCGDTEPSLQPVKLCIAFVCGNRAEKMRWLLNVVPVAKSMVHQCPACWGVFLSAIGILAAGDILLLSYRSRHSQMDASDHRSYLHHLMHLGISPLL